jgi:hypothetical protein
VEGVSAGQATDVVVVLEGVDTDRARVAWCLHALGRQSSIDVIVVVGVVGADTLKLVMGRSGLLAAGTGEIARRTSRGDGCSVASCVTFDWGCGFWLCFLGLLSLAYPVFRV